MGSDIFEISVNTFKIVLIFLITFQMVPILVWTERRGSAFIQNRLGPNRVGPFGLFHLLADFIKFIFKEDLAPQKSNRFLFYLAPIIAPLSAALAFGALPLSMPVHIESFQFLGQQWGPYDFLAQSYHFDAGLLFVLGVSSLGVYTILLAGYGSGSTYPLMGALRGAAQVISYELSLGLSLVGVLLIYKTFNFQEMIQLQQEPLNFYFFGKQMSFSFLPNWGIFYQPLGALLFFVAAFAETNRLPFDLPEAEAELVSGYHTEYGGLKMLMFYVGEYIHMMVASGLMAIFYFGGYDIPFLSSETVSEFFSQMNLHANFVRLLTSGVFAASFALKILFFLWVFIWVRWSLPRFRYDHLMDLGWKVLLPWTLVNAMVTALLIFWMRF